MMSSPALAWRLPAGEAEEGTEGSAGVSFGAQTLSVTGRFISISIYICVCVYYIYMYIIYICILYIYVCIFYNYIVIFDIYKVLPPKIAQLVYNSNQDL